MGGISLVTAREKEEEGEEKGEPRDPTSLSLDDPDPPLPSLARRHKCTSSCPRRLRGGDEVVSSRSSLRLRRRGEEAGRRSYTLTRGLQYRIVPLGMVGTYQTGTFCAAWYLSVPCVGMLGIARYIPYRQLIDMPVRNLALT
ncbi:hypothetical protein BHM03_00047092 [Ensete ventricosum]|nr:hypothetical protein BHM03_00047092 [Ensete ventricosum]